MVQHEQSFWIPSLLRHWRSPAKGARNHAIRWWIAGALGLSVLGLDLWISGTFLVPLLYFLPIWVVSRNAPRRALGLAGICSILVLIAGANAEAFSLPLKWQAVDDRLFSLAAIWAMGWSVRTKRADGIAFLRRFRSRRLARAATGGMNSSEIVAARDDERRRIARELHDDLGQRLTALSFQIELGLRSDPQQYRQRLLEAQNGVRQVLTHVRDVAMELRPAIVEDLGLLAALQWQYERYAAQTGIQVAAHHDLELEQRFAPEIESTLFRVIQEALTNVARYAGVQQVSVQIWQEPDALVAEVRDHGAGFDPNSIAGRRESLGLAGMRERVALVGGEVAVESQRNRGTRVRARLPLPSAIEG
jgi:signal transduction histidine kinase